MMRRKIFITGGHGYIGRNILERLDTKYLFYSPSHQELDLLKETEVKNYLKKHKFDVIIHAAVEGGSRPDEQVEQMTYHNLRMFYNLTMNKRYFGKMIFFGSGAEYDKSRPLIKIKEEEFDELVPKDEYGYFKYLCSKYIEKSDGIVNLRIFGVYGKYEDYKLRFISNAICRNLLGLPIIIRNKNVYFDFMYINDLTRIIEYFIDNDVKYKFYNVGRGNRIDLYSLAKKIISITKNKSAIKIYHKGLNNEYTCDVSRLREEIPNFRYTNFDVSIRELVAYYHSILPSIKRNVV